MKLVTVVGARPQFIKAAPLSLILREKYTEILLHTGQHYDSNMSELFFSELSIPRPDYNLGVGSGSHGQQTGQMLTEIERILLQEQPDGVIVYGDTNSTLAGALAASKLHIPVFHVEAGLRSYNKGMPEEQNRVLTDHLSTMLFCPTETAVDNLSKEGITEDVYFTGDIMYDAVLQFSDLSKELYGNGLWLQKIATYSNEGKLDLSLKNYYLATIHRAENTDDREKLETIFNALGQLEKPVVLPLHPRTRKALGDRVNFLAPNIVVIEPIGYLFMLYLTANAYMVLTDSGGLQKEAYFLKTPCTTLRNETEWVETLENGWNVLSDIEASTIVQRATRSLDYLGKTQRDFFGDGQAAKKIIEKIEMRL